jgi:hypothetical protein
MDSARFDALARSLAITGSRRRALAVSLSGALGLLGLARPDAATAAKSRKCRPKCAECEKCQKGDCERKNGKKVCKRGKCKPKPDGTACAGGKSCQAGICACAVAECSGACVDTRSDPRDCGSCGKRCGVNEQCVAGQCRCPHQSGGDEICSPGAICCPTKDDCTCIGGGQFLDPATCAAVEECPSDSTPCTSTSNACLGTVSTRVCCPSGTTCTAEGTCLQ